MSPTSTPLTVLIAANDPTHSAALTEMVQSIRPGVRTLQFANASEAETRNVEIAMVVEPAGPELGELSSRVRATCPDVALAVIAPRFDERAIEVAAGVGAAAIVASPCDAGALLRVLSDLDRRIRFGGRCRAIETLELLRLHAAAHSAGVLHLAGEAGTGAIHFDDGQPIHAHTPTRRGADAVRELLGWPDAKLTWIAGRSASTRTIVGRIDGLLERPLEAPVAREEVDDAPRDVIDKLERLATIEDILAVYLMRNSDVVIGRNGSDLDDETIGRALSRLSLVFHDMEEQQGDGAGSEIQATVGAHRLVVDRLGPSRLGFQIGVVVRQATPVCKSLRRLIRQIDRSFRKSLAAGGRATPPGITASAGASATGLHRVA